MLHVHFCYRFTLLLFLTFCCVNNSFAQPGTPDACADFTDADIGPLGYIYDAELIFSSTNDNVILSNHHPVLGSSPNGFDYFDSTYLATQSNFGLFNIDLSRLTAHTEFLSFEFMAYFDTLSISVNGNDTVFFSLGNQNTVDLGNSITLIIDEESNVPSPWHAGVMTIIGNVEQLMLNLGGEAMIDNVCYGLQQYCAIHELTVEYECTPNGVFYVELNLDFQNTSDSFSVAGNGINYGTFSYASLPIRLGPFPGDGQTDYEFVAIDQQNPNCQNFFELGPIDCSTGGPCSITNVRATTSDCNADNQYNVTIDFDYRNVGNMGFLVIGNGNFYGAYDYADLPITLPVLFDADGSILQFNIFDLSEPSCINFAEVGPVDCNDICEIHPNSIRVDPGNCNPNGSYELYLDFEVSNPGNDFFDVFAENGNLIGTYRLAELPLTIPNFEGNGGNTDVVTICINDNPDCCARKEFDAQPCNNCEIGSLEAEVIECVDSSFYIRIDFEYANVSDSFYLDGNGQDYGLFAYQDLPVTLGPLHADGTTFYEFIAIDFNHPDCRNFIEFGKVDCPNAPCEIRDLQATFLDCNPAGGYSLKINFAVSNPGNDFFDVYAGNGDFVGFFPLTDLPLTIPNFPGDGGNTDVVNICINDNPNCCARTEFDIRDCGSNCEIGEIEAEVIDCIDSSFYVRIDFDFANTTSDTFQLRGNGVDYGFWLYDDLPITLGPLVADGTTPYEFVVIDFDNPNCSNAVNLGKVDCSNNACEIRDLQATFLDCNPSGGYNLKINFNVSNPGNDFFDVYAGNGDFVGFFPLADLPLTIPNFPGDGGNTDVVNICINDNPNCCARTEFDIRDCGGDCEIGRLEAEVIECVDSSFYIRIDFEYVNTSDSFQLRGNGRDYGLFAYQDLPVTLGPLAADGTTFYEFVAIDFENPDCRNAVDLGKVDCTNDCQSENEAQPIACNSDGSFSVQYYLDFFTDPTDSVLIYFNTLNNYYGTFSLADMPILIPDFPNASGSTNAKIIAITADGSCRVITEFTPLNCGDCELFNLETSISDCNDNDQFDITIDFDFRNIGNIGFQVLDDQGNAYGPFNYNELPITLENFDAIPGGVTRFNIFDILNFNCSLIADVDHPNCDNFCDGFESVAPGDYPAADFEEDEAVFFIKDVPVYMLPFQYFDGTSDRSLFRVEEVFNNQWLPVRANTLYAGASTALFDFSGLNDKVTRLTIDITTGHPEYNIAVNGEPVQVVSNLFLLSQNIAPGVKLDVSFVNNTGEVIRLTLTGDIQSLRLSGVESYMDNLCIETEAFADRECIQFEGLPCCLALTPANTDIGTVIHVENRVPVTYLGGTLWIENQGRCGDFITSTGNHLFFDGRLGLDFTELPENPDEVSFSYSSCENQVSIRFNNSSNFEAIPLTNDTSFTTASGLTIAIRSNNANTATEGQITINGDISSLVISGQGFGIDDICFTNPDGLIVWPGDANNDNIANHFDLLHIGMAFGQLGPNRGTVTDDWTEILSSEWRQLFGDQETDFMHADCNGDGRIDLEDVEVLEQNYGETHGSYPILIEIPADEDDPALYLDMTNNTSIRNGGSLNIPLRLGTDDIPVEGLYGLAFTLEYDPRVIDPNTINLNLSDSWLGEMGTEVILLQKHFPQEGRIEVAMSRIDQTEVTGRGDVASVIGIIDNIAGKVTTDIGISDIKAINANDMRIAINTEGGSMEVITSNKNLPMKDRLGLFPNPAHQTITISSPVSMEHMEIYDILGRRITNTTLNHTVHRMSVQEWPSGVYYANILLTDGQSIVKKFEVVKH